MKKSYWIYSGILLLIVIVMIVVGAIQDHKTKKDKLKRSAVATLTSAGCVEVDDDYNPELMNENLLHSGDDVDLSSLENAKNLLPQYKDSDLDGQYLFTMIGSSVLKNAKFYISSTKISGRDAKVKVHIFYQGREGDITLEYFYYDGEWRLSNTMDALSDIMVDGQNYDDVEQSAYEVIVNEMKNI